MLTITNLEIADLLVSLYAGDSSKFDFVESGSGDDGVCWALKTFKDDASKIDVVLLRGSITLEDWMRDFNAITSPFVHKQLGPVHPGFLVGMADSWREIRMHSTGPWIVAGHSLGAGRAAVLSGLMTLEAAPPIRRVAFGEPKPGFKQLSDLLSPVDSVSYRNGDSRHHDLVTDVPLSFPPENYVHPNQLSFVTSSPGADIQSKWGVFAWHHMPLYRDAIAKLNS